MNKIICDSCKQEIKPKIEKKFLDKGIVIQFFRCKCSEKYLIDVTDKETREKQIELRKRADARKKALDVVIDDMSEEELTMLADETKFNIDRLERKIKEVKAELKERYEGEL